MNRKNLYAFVFLLLALIFTIGLTFASIELPKTLDNLISNTNEFVNVYTGGGDLQDIKTEFFIRHFHLRTVGYICLILIIVLIIIGFITEKTGLATLGAFAIFLPVFGHFAATMFFLGGLGFLRVIWLPGLEISFNMMKFADAVFIPYRMIIDGFGLIGINLNLVLPYFLISLGLLIFCYGTVIWFYTYFNKIGLAKLWIYKYCRHPQYLGWIIWSYGILFLPGENLKQNYSLSDSLPWLISTLVIIGVAMVEELKMGKIYKDEFETYRRDSYFMMPFPKYFCKTISAPFRVFFDKNYPTRKREIVAVLAFYFVLTVTFTVMLNSAAKMIAPGKWVFISEDSRNVNELAKLFIETPQRRAKHSISESLISKGDSSLNIFISFLNHQNPVVREFSADALGKLNSIQALQPLIESIDDENWRVQSSVVRSLGMYKSDSAVNSLIELLNSDNYNIKSSAAGALVQIGSQKAIESVIPMAEEDIIQPDDNLVLALSRFPSERSEELLLNYFQHEKISIRRTAVIAAQFFKSEKIKSALKRANNDEDWEVRIFAREALNEVLKHN